MKTLDGNIDWLRIVLDYCERNPNRLLGSFGLEFGYYNNSKLSELKLKHNRLALEIDNCTSPIRHIDIFARTHSKGVVGLMYFKYNKLKLKDYGLLPDHIIIELMTDGMEDQV